MGNFYVNFSVKTRDQRQVASVLQRARRVAIVTPAQQDYLVVYDEAADRQAEEPILEVGSLLSREMDAPAIAVLNHDDDILCYWLFERGRLIDSYNSHPDDFGESEGGTAEQSGDTERLCQALGVADRASEVNSVLRGDHVFAIEKHQHLARILGLPSWSVGFGYRYVSQGELGEGLQDAQLLHTTPAERGAQVPEAGEQVTVAQLEQATKHLPFFNYTGSDSRFHYFLTREGRCYKLSKAEWAVPMAFPAGSMQFS